MLSPDTPPSAHTPASWRDVYTLVEGMEQRLLARMDEIADGQQKIADDHEVRLRVLEHSDTGRAGGDKRGDRLTVSYQGWLAVVIAGISMLVAMGSVFLYSMVMP